MENLELWQNFGIAGMVIGALFACLFLGVRQVTGLLESHKDERSEWLKAYQDITNRMLALQQENNVVLRALEGTIKEANLRHRYYENDGK